MEDRPVIMVQVEDPQWTADVLHDACRLARNCGGEIALVHMVRVRSLLYLGTDFGYLDLSDEDKQRLAGYVETAEDYGLPHSVTLYQYSDLYEGIVDAVELVGACIAFGRLPKSTIPFWRECRFELLRNRLLHQHVELFGGPGDWGQRTPLHPTSVGA